MKITIPQEITSSNIVSSDIPEVAPPEFDIGETYTEGELASVENPNGEILVYQSLQDGNTGNTPSSSPLWWRIVSIVHPEFDIGETYTEGFFVMDLAQHAVYQSLQDGNTGNEPSSSPLWWVFVGPTNLLAPFDGRISSIASRTEKITYNLAFFNSTFLDTLAFFALDATSISVQMKNSDETVVYEEEFYLTDNSLVWDFWTYAFEPIIRSKELMVNLPPYAQFELEITISAGTAESLCRVGEICIGWGRKIGVAVQGSTVGFLDFSKKVVDEFGNIDIVRRDFSAVCEYDVSILTNSITGVKNVMSENRATPLIFSGVDTNGDAFGTLLYGFFEDFSIVVQGAVVSQCSIRVQSLSQGD